jgi:hypothetical protein
MPTLRVVPELTRSVDIKLNERPLLLSAVGDLSSVQVARLNPQGRSPLARLGVATFRGREGRPRPQATEPAPRRQLRDEPSGDRPGGLFYAAIPLPRSVPELTRITAIQLNKRLSLRRRDDRLG